MRHRSRLLRRLRHAVLGSADAARPAEASPSPSAGRPRAAQRGVERREEADLLQFEAEARYQRDRLALYNARMVTGRPASTARLEELRRLSAAAAARVARAKERRVRPHRADRTTLEVRGPVARGSRGAQGCPRRDVRRSEFPPR